MDDGIFGRRGEGERRGKKKKEEKKKGRFPLPLPLSFSQLPLYYEMIEKKVNILKKEVQRAFQELNNKLIFQEIVNAQTV